MGQRQIHSYLEYLGEHETVWQEVSVQVIFCIQKVKVKLVDVLSLKCRKYADLDEENMW